MSNESEVNKGPGRVSREIRGNIFLIGLDRAGKRNAFDSAMLIDLALALGEYEKDPGLRCAVLFAKGAHFTAGLDLMELAPKLAGEGLSYSSEGLDPFGVTGPRRTKPLIVALHGMCWTAAIELALNADMVIASEDAHFSQLEVMRGIPPAGGATVRFVQAAGWVNAMRYMLTGEEFSAEEALRMNIVNEVVPAGSQLDRAIEFAERIAKAAPLAVISTLASANQARYEGDEAALAGLNKRLTTLIKSKDVSEGIMAMMERREPHFKGE